MNGIKRDYFWNTLGVFLQNAISPLLLLVVTRVNGIEAVGVFSFAFAVSLMLWMLSMWGGRTYQVSDTQSEFTQRSYMMVRVTLALAVIVIAIIFCFVNQYDIHKSALIMLLVFFKLIESFSDVLYGVLHLHGKLYISGKSLTAKAILGFIVFIMIDILTEDVLLAAFGLVLVNFIIFLTYDYKLVNKIEPIRFPLGKMKFYLGESIEILKRCSGIFIIFFLAMFSLNIPRYFIDIYKTEDVGYFGIIAMPITLIVLMMSFILQPNVLRITKLYREGNLTVFRKTVERILLFSLTIGLVVFLITAFIGAELLQIIFGIGFDNHRNALIVIVLGGVASALVTIYLNVFVIMRKIEFSLAVLIVTNCLLIPFSLIMVQSEGLLGGVWAFSIANITQLLLISAYFKVSTNEYEKN